MTTTATAPRVALVMGSQSDWATMRHAATVLGELGVAMRRGSSRRIARPSGCSTSPRARVTPACR